MLATIAPSWPRYWTTPAAVTCSWSGGSTVWAAHCRTCSPSPGDLHDRGVELRSLTEAIDTTTAGGQLIFHLFGAVAEFERAVAAECTAAGVAAGRHPGRPSLAADTIAAVQALDEAGTPRAQIARTLGVSRSSIYRYLEAT